MKTALTADEQNYRRWVTQIALTIAKGGEAAYQRFLADPKAEVKAAHAVLQHAFQEFAENETPRAKAARAALIEAIWTEARKAQTA